MNLIKDPSESLHHSLRDTYLRAVIETTQDAFVVISGAENVIDFNHAFLRLTGYSAAEAALLCLDDIVPPDKQDFMSSHAAILEESGSDLLEAIILKKDGTPLDVEITVTLHSCEQDIIVCFIRDISERKKSEKSLLMMHDLMRYIIEHNRSAVAVHDKQLRYMYVSRPYLEAFHISDTDLIGKYHYDVFPELPEKLKTVHKRVLQGDIVRCEEEEFSYPDGCIEWMRWECRPWYSDDGQIGGLVLYAEIITERKLVQMALLNEKEHLKTTLLSVGEGVIATDKHGSIKIMNPAAETLTGWNAAEAIGKYIESVFELNREDTGKPYTRYIKRVLSSGKTVTISSNAIMCTRTNREIPVEITAAPIMGNGGGIAGAVIVIRDFSENRAKQKQIEYLSYNDFATGLYNRRYMAQALKKMDIRRNLPISIMIIDVNGLKLTNDAFGHDTGDHLIKHVADMLKRICRSVDIVGRTGGDEFTLLLPQTDADQAELVVSRIREATAQIKLEPVIVSLAIGFAVKTSSAQDVNTVMLSADNMMYKDKIKHGRHVRNQTIDMIISSINLNYSQEQRHTERVSKFCDDIARAMSLSEKDIQAIKTAGLLHDIGKIIVPPHLLNKVEPLTRDEFEIIKRHPEIGYQMLKSVDQYAPLAEYVLYHHERYDGGGYPEGLRGDQIPLYSRIIAVADAYEAMTSARPYHQQKTKQNALSELLRCSGSQFDPEIVDVFVHKVMGLAD